MITPMICALLLAISLEVSGETEIKDIGTIALPPGIWATERLHFSTDDEKTPDVVVFRKKGDVVERLTILRYRNNISPKKPVYLCDSVADSLLFGIPYFLDPENDNICDGTIHMLRKPDDWYAPKIEVTYIYPDEAGTQWMSHAVLAAKNDCTFVYLHCAPKVLSPDTVLNVYFESEVVLTGTIK